MIISRADIALNTPAHVPANWPGWLVIIIAGLLVLSWLLKVLKG